MKKPTPGAPPPEATAGSWVGFGNAQTSQLDVANATHEASLDIIATCERKYNELVKSVSKRKWF